MAVCCINTTVVCVHVLLFGPITADMLVRGGDGQPGGNLYKNPEQVGLESKYLRKYCKSDGWDSTGGCVCVSFKYCVVWTGAFKKGG